MSLEVQMARRFSDASRRTVLSAASVVVSASIVLGGIPIASADPYDDDTSTEVVDAVPEAPEPEAPEPEQQAPEPEPEAPAFEPEAPGAQEEQPVEEPGSQAPEPAPQQDEPGSPGSEPAPGESPAPQEPGTPAESGVPQSSSPDEDLIVPDLDEADAPDGDVHTADTGTATAVDPDVASTSEIDDLREVVETQMTSTTSTSSSSTTSWNQGVSSWNSSWLSYDTYYRPVIMNPYQLPLQLIYTYDNAPRIVTVNPLQRVVLDASKPGVYSFTALTRSDPKTVATASVGSFSGGGYVPKPGQPPPPKPAALQSFENLLVQLQYAKGSSKPFRVKHLTDLGDDPAVGARRVLLDYEIPAWGQWSKTGSGERLFAISKTDLLPGLTSPSEGKLPGYNVQLAADQKPASASHSWGVWLWVAIAAAGVVGVGAVIVAFLLVRRRKA
jgi:outer membrane biosynthesis protein TonB